MAKYIDNAVVVGLTIPKSNEVTEKNPQTVVAIGTSNYGSLGQFFRVNSLEEATALGITNNPAYSINMFLHNHFAVSGASVVCLNTIDTTDDESYEQEEQICAVEKRNVKSSDLILYPIKRENGIFTVKNASTDVDITLDTVFKMKGTDTIFVRDASVTSVKINSDIVKKSTAKTNLLALESAIMQNNAVKYSSFILALDFTDDNEVQTMIRRICGNVRLVTAVSQDKDNAVNSETIWDEIENQLPTSIYGNTIALANQDSALNIGIATSAKARVYSDIDGFYPIIEGAWLFVSLHSSSVNLQEKKSEINFSNIVSLGEEISYNDVYYTSGNTNPDMANNLARYGVNALVKTKGRICFISSVNASRSVKSTPDIFYQNSVATNLMVYYAGQLLSYYIDEPIVDGFVESLELNIENSLKQKLSGFVNSPNGIADISFRIDSLGYAKNVQANIFSYIPYTASYSPVIRGISYYVDVIQDLEKLRIYINNQVNPS